MYYFKNSSGNRGFIFPGGFMVNDNQGSLPIYYSLDETRDSNKRWDNVTDYLIVLQGFKLISYEGTNYNTARQSLDRSSSSTPRYERAGTSTSSLDYRHGWTQSCGLFYNGSTSKTEGTDS